ADLQAACIIYLFDRHLSCLLAGFTNRGHVSRQLRYDAYSYSITLVAAAHNNQQTREQGQDDECGSLSHSILLRWGCGSIAKMAQDCLVECPLCLPQP